MFVIVMNQSPEAQYMSEKDKQIKGPNKNSIMSLCTVLTKVI